MKKQRRLIIDISEEQYLKAKSLFPYGTRKPILSAILDELLSFASHYGMGIVYYVASHPSESLRLFKFVQILNSLKLKGRSPDGSRIISHSVRSTFNGRGNRAPSTDKACKETAKEEGQGQE